VITYSFVACEKPGKFAFIHPTFDLKEENAGYAYEQLMAHEWGFVSEDWILRQYDAMWYGSTKNT